jgi:MFS family permease
MASPDPSRRSPAAALRYRDFRLFQAGRLAAVVGAQILSVAVGWHVYDVTRRPLDLGYVGLAQFLPGFVLALPAGHLADRLDRRRIIAVCQAVYLLTALSLLATARAGASVYPVYALLVVFGAARGVSGPAGQALMPDLVPAEHFGNAVAWSSSAWQIATIIGPAAGGIVYAAGGAPLAYALSAGLFATSFAAYWMIRTSVSHASTGDVRSWRTVLAGVEYVWRKKVVLGALSLDLFAVLLGGATALLPVYARDILRVGPAGLGALRAAPGLGAAVTALALAYRPLGSRAGVTLFSCVGLFGVATVVFGLSRSFALSLVALVVLGAADLVSVVVRHTVVQLKTPPEMRGRVSAVNVVFIGASNELGEFESGVTAAMLGVVPAVVLGGLGTCVVVLACAWLFPELRRIDRLDASEL